MEVKECIILAGGKGTRLSAGLPGIPKCLAPLAGKPFLYWLMQYLSAQKIKRFIFALGHMHEQIEKYLSEEYADRDIIFSVEAKPLGTGGAIRSALKQCTGAQVWVINGDTIFETDHERMLYYHIQNGAACTLALKPMKNYDRYGSVETDLSGTIIAFTEKKYTEQGLVNGGVYLVDRMGFEQTKLPEIFSFEKDYVEKYCGAQKMIGVPDDGYFIDIGIPEDLEKANKEFKLRKDVLNR